MNPSEVMEAAIKLIPSAISATASRGEASLVIDSSEWASVAKKLFDAGYTFLSDLTGVDYLGAEPRFEVVANLLDMQTPARLRIRVRVADGDPPKCPSVTSIWPTADWHERETFDMFGIQFEGHPDMRRILMPDEWIGNPLRKDYAVGKVPVEYKTINPGFRT